jgi:hypothetical protein
VWNHSKTPSLGDETGRFYLILGPRELSAGYRYTTLRTGMEIIPQHYDETRPEWELARLEVLGIAHGESGLIEVEIAKREPDEFA